MTSSSGEKIPESESACVYSSTPPSRPARLLDYLGSCRRFVHHIGCATAVAALKSAANVQHATMVTAMGGNGVEFGIKLSGRGEQWFTAPFY